MQYRTNGRHQPVKKKKKNRRKKNNKKDSMDKTENINTGTAD